MCGSFIKAQQKSNGGETTLSAGRFQFPRPAHTALLKHCLRKRNMMSVFPPSFLYESGLTQCERLFWILSMICASKRPCDESKQWLVRHQPGCLEAGNNHVRVWWSERAPFFSVSAAGGISVWRVGDSRSLPLLVYPCSLCICTHSPWFTPHTPASRHSLTCLTCVRGAEPSGQEGGFVPGSRPSSRPYIWRHQNYKPMHMESCRKPLN